MSFEMSLDYRLRWLDFDRYGRIQPYAIVDMCQDVATIHAESMGIGRDDMLAGGVFWAVVRTKIEFMKQPSPFQVLTFRTWPHTASSFSFLRDFEVTDQNGDKMAVASTEWVLMDVDSRKFARMKDHYSGPLDFCEDRVFPEKPRKLRDFDGGSVPARTVTPAFSDIDVNGHVNNARYLPFVADAFALGPDAAFRSIQIDYRHEALFGSPLDIYTRREEDAVLAKAVRQDGQVAFACAAELQPYEPPANTMLP